MGAFVDQWANEGNGSSGTLTVSLTGVTGGNNLYCGESGTPYNSTVSISSDVDGAFTLPTETILTDSGDDWQMMGGYLLNVTGGDHTITVTYGSSSAFRGIVVQEWSGHLTSGAYDATPSDAVIETTGTTRTNGPGGTVSGAGDYVCFGMDYGVIATPTAGSGFTGGTAVWFYGGGTAACLPEYRAYTSGTASATWGMNSGATSYCIGMYFLNAGGGGANPKGPLGLPLHGPLGGPI